MRDIEVKGGVASFVRPQEGHLQGETVHQLEFSPHNLARRRFLALLHLEGAVIEAEHVEIFAEQPNSKNVQVKYCRYSQPFLFLNF